MCATLRLDLIHILIILQEDTLTVTELWRVQKVLEKSVEGAKKGEQSFLCTIRRLT